MKGAEWLLDALAADGVDLLFGNPGSTELPLMDALAGRSTPRYVLGLHEGVVLGMADGYSQQSDRLAAVNVHVQPGLANALAGILNAARARVPLLVTVGQQASALLDGAPFLGGDVVGMAAPLAKGAWEVESPADLPQAYRRAVQMALTHPRGPVVLSLPLDVQYGLLEARAQATPEPPSPAEPDPDRIRRAASLLTKARAPVVLMGDGIAHREGGAAVASLAEGLGAPIWGEPFAARIGLDTGHHLYRGLLPGFAAAIRERLAEHDVIVALGMPVFRYFGESPGPALVDQTLIHVDVDPEEIGRIHAPACGMVADPAATAGALAVSLGAPTDAARARAADWSGRIAEQREAATTAAETSGSEAPLSALEFSSAIARHVEPEDVIVEEALTAGRPLRSVLAPRAPGSWLAHRGSALGWGLPAAVGVACAAPGRRVLALQGDGGALFGLSALWTAAAEGLPLALVIADNGGYEILHAGLEAYSGHRDGGWPGLALAEPRLDLVSLARGFGADAVALSDADGDIDTALEDLWDRASAGPAVLVVPVGGGSPPQGYPPSAANASR